MPDMGQTLAYGLSCPALENLRSGEWNGLVNEVIQGKQDLVLLLVLLLRLNFWNSVIEEET